MQRFHRRNFYWMITIIVVYALIHGLIAGGILKPFYLNTLMTIMFNIIYALGLNLVLGVAGQFSLGHAGFIAIGAYSSAILSKSMDNSYLGLALGILVGIGLSILLALIVGIPTLRLRGDYLAIATLGASEIIRVFINNWRGVTNGPAGIAGIPIITTWQLTYWLLILTSVLILNYFYSSVGRATYAISQDEVAAEAMGVRVTRYKVAAFVLGAATAAIGGALQANYIGVVTPGDFTFNRSIDVLVIVVFGGIGSFTGTIVAAIVLGVINTLLQDYGQLRMVIYGGVLVLMMLFKPGGLFAQKELRIGQLLDRIFHRSNKEEIA